MVEHRNNRNLKLMILALRLKTSDLLDIFENEIYTGQTSKNQINGWTRSPNAKKNATGNSPAHTVSRYKPMPDDMFDVFCKNLDTWINSHYEELIERWTETPE